MNNRYNISGDIRTGEVIIRCGNKMIGYVRKSKTGLYYGYNFNGASTGPMPSQNDCIKEVISWNDTEVEP